MLWTLSMGNRLGVLVKYNVHSVAQSAVPGIVGSILSRACTPGQL